MHNSCNVMHLFAASGVILAQKPRPAKILLDFDQEQVRILSLGAVGPPNVWRWFRETLKNNKSQEEQ